MNLIHFSVNSLLATAWIAAAAAPDDRAPPPPPPTASAAPTAPAAPAGALRAPPPTPGVLLRILALNDFHGHLEPTRLNVDAMNGPHLAGGAAALAQALTDGRAPVEHHVFVAAGDLIGASPLISSVADDEPTVELLGDLGLRWSSLGNHELDDGWAELLRLQNGCPDGACEFAGASFQWLAANVVRVDGEPFLPGSAVETFGGVRVGFVGAVTIDTPSITVAGATDGLLFLDEVEAVNAEVDRLLADGVRAIVLLIHEGGRRTHDRINACDGLTGRIAAINAGLHPEVDAVISGHTHALYECELGGRPVTSALSYGQMLTHLDLQLDPTTGDVVGHQVMSRVVSADNADPAIAARVEVYAAAVAAVANEPLGSTSTLDRIPDAGGTSSLGRVVAEAILAGAPGAQVAVHNAGGVRADLSGPITYSDAHRVLPFGNTIVTVELDGAELQALLEEQWTRTKGDSALQIAGATYAWDPTAPPGSRVRPGSVRIGGEPLDPAATYRVATNSYLADGGDGYRGFAAGRNRLDGAPLLDAFADYIRANTPLNPPPERVRRETPPPPEPAEPEAPASPPKPAGPQPAPSPEPASD